MATRTSETTVTFCHPFYLSGLDEVQPAGLYHVELDEELIQGISFVAYRRVMALIHLHSENEVFGLTRPFNVAPTELEAALKRDREPKAGIAVRLPST